MRDSQTLSVDVSELLRHPGAGLTFRTTSRIGGLGVPLAWVPDDSDLDVSLDLEALVDGIHVTGSVGAEMRMRCRRCLTEQEMRRRIDVAEIVAYPADEREDAYRLDGETLHLEGMIRDVVTEELPFNPLCRSDCAGLCPVCGADLNEERCGHDVTPTDIRWGPLQDLKDRLEG